MEDSWKSSDHEPARQARTCCHVNLTYTHLPHHALIEGNYRQTSQGLSLTVGLGIYFTILQGLGYYEARFTFADRVYGSTFFIATGFHGLHVIVGTIFLIITWFRHTKGEFSAAHHFGFEAA